MFIKYPSLQGEAWGRLSFLLDLLWCHKRKPPRGKDCRGVVRLSSPLGETSSLIRIQHPDAEKQLQVSSYFQPMLLAYCRSTAQFLLSVCSTFFSFAGAKVLLFFNLCKYFLIFDTFSYDIVHLTFRSDEVDGIIDQYFAY